MRRITCMIDILATLAVLLHLHAPVMVDAGYVTPYADGVMQRVYERRAGGSAARRQRDALLCR